jgi:O-antigen ligase
VAPRFRPLNDLPTFTRLAALTYLAHIACQGWIASSQSFLGLSIIFTAIALKRREIGFRFHPIFVPIAIYVTASWLSVAFAAHRTRAFAQAGEWFNFLTIVVGITLYRAHPRLLRVALSMFAALATFLASYGIFQYFVLGSRDLEHRITGTTAHVMTYSGMIMPISLFFVVLWLTEKRRAWLASGVLAAFALVLTFTRGAWLGWLAGAATFIGLRQRRWFLYAIPIVIVGLLLSPLSIFARLVSVFDTRQSSNLDRVRMVQAGVEMIRDHPIVGVGPGNIKEIYPLYRLPDAPRTKVPHLHNNPVQIWAERGIVCFLAYLFLMGLFLWTCMKARSGPARAYAEGGIAAAVALFLAGLTEFNFGDTEVLLTMLDLMAIVLIGIESSATTATVADRSIDSSAQIAQAHA